MLAEAFGITVTLFILGLIGLAIEGNAIWLSGAGLLALAITFVIFFAVIYLWTLWFYRKRK